MIRARLHPSHHRALTAARLAGWSGVLLFVLMIGQTPAALAQTTGVHDFYGLNFVAPYDPWLSLARESGAGVVRWQFNWRDIEPVRGAWNWDATDRAIRAWNEAGLSVHAILHNPPDDALVRPGGLVPTSINLPWDHPDNRWGRYCYEFAHRYRGQIGSYEVWNEPDLTIYWEGTAQEYFTLLRSCYLAIKAADPAVLVSMAGMALLIDPQFFPEVVRLASRDPDGPRHNYYFDVASIHMYASPELVYSLTRDTRETLRRYGMGSKPIWITEANIPLRGAGIAPDYPHWRYATEDEAAWFVLQAVSNAYASGARRLMFFRLADDGMDEAFGLVAGNSQPRASYRALQLAAALMHDIVSAQRELRDGIVITNLRRADGARIVTLYSVTGVTVDIAVPAETSAAVLINAVGGHSTIRPGADGAYVVRLLPARGRDQSRIEDYSVGGPPLVIVEYDRDGPTTAISARTAPSNSREAVVSWQGDDGLYGTGVASFNVEVSHDGGPWQTWLEATTLQEAVYDLSAGGSYTFRARAVDNAGNIGPYSEAAGVGLFATLVAQIVDLRGQSVPFARVELEDGSLHDADPNGLLRLDLPPGTYRILRVDGSAQGAAQPPPVRLTLGEETQVTWLLEPQTSAVINGGFDGGLWGWQTLPGGLVHAADLHPDQRRVLRLQGTRLPWGTPFAAAPVVIPAGMDAAVLSFNYHLPSPGSHLRLRVIGEDGQQILWQAGQATPQFARVWQDVSGFAGQTVEVRFELWGAKGAAPGLAEIDDVIVANVPVLYR